MLVYGPVPSRRLGRSLGVNNIPPKRCSYACAYCQVGRTTRLQVRRQGFHEPQEILAELRARLHSLAERGERVDYVSFVPDGEPTLDARLGETVSRIRELGVAVAVISNASLMDQEPVRRDLLQADWVSLKLDAAEEGPWRRLNHPHRALSLDPILDGMRSFAGAYPGRLYTETMLVEGVNDQPESLERTAAAARLLSPATAYLSVPTRPPAQSWVRPPAEDSLLQAYQVFAAKGLTVEILSGSEGNGFAASGEAAADLLSITAVHPMRRSAVEDLLRRDGADWALVESLLGQEKLVQRSYGGETFYLRRFPRPG